MTMSRQSEQVLRDVINTSVLPPLEMIIANNAKQAAGVTDEEKVGSWEYSRILSGRGPDRLCIKS